MTERIEKLREQSLNAINRISAERALLVTEFYNSDRAQEVSIPVRRAMAFDYIMRNKEICINDGELIVGERGFAPKATPTYPEITLHSLEDLDILDSRDKVSFKVDAETRKAYEDTIIPYWKGKTNRERIFSLMPKEWIDAYEAGVFTEFQEQRAPGHTVGGKKLFEKGLLDLINEIEESEANIDILNDPNAFEKKEELKAMRIAANAINAYAERYSDKLSALARKSGDKKRKAELEEMARICKRVPAYAPETFHEALQHYWFIHLGVITELNPWDSFNPGRLDQHVFPFYSKELRENRL
ncbi:MAG: pyruvate formate lyase family protein, partial [Bacteroidales bacterium]